MSGQSVRYLRGFVVVLVILLVCCTVVVPFGASGTETRPELVYGNIVAGNDYTDSGASQALFHRSTLATTDDEALAISLPYEESGYNGGSPAGTAPIEIAQTSSDTIAATSTGLFEANYLFSPAINYGAAPVGTGYFGVPQPVSTALFTSNSLMYPEMVVRGNLIKDKEGEPAALGISLPPLQSGPAYNAIGALAAKQENADAIGYDARDAGMPVILSSRTIDFDASPEQIDNTSIVDRLWRNTHQGSIMDYIYEGDAAYPQWIAPYKNPLILIDCGDSLSTMKFALKMTRAGTFLVPSFWSI